MVLLRAVKRGCDSAGCGHFGASRGSRVHNGIDYKAEPNQEVLTHVAGIVTKLGFTYSDDLSYRYVEVTTYKYHMKHRFFYVLPNVTVGDRVSVGDLIGFAQDIVARYPDSGMQNHVHYEIKDSTGAYIDPETIGARL